MNRFIASTLIAIATIAVASASKTSDRAHDVIVLKVQSSGYERVSFTSTRESRGAGDEYRVYGTGVAFKKDRDRSNFNYSVIVNSKNMRARDVQVDYAGDSDSGDIGNNTFSVSRPKRNEVFRTNTIPFSGRAVGRGSVSIRVYDRNDRVVASKSVSPRNNDWSTTIGIRNDGAYRAVISHNRIDREVRFRVNDRDEGWGNSGNAWENRPGGDWDSHNLEINTPSNGGSASGSELLAQGTALNMSRVRLRVLRGGSAIYNQTRDVRNGRWEARIPLARGAYQLEVSSTDGRQRKFISFSMK